MRRHGEFEAAIPNDLHHCDCWYRRFILLCIFRHILEQFSCWIFCLALYSFFFSVPSVSHEDSRQALNFSESTIVHAVPNPVTRPRKTGMQQIWEIPPRTKKMPPLKAFRLTKELVQQRVEDNIIIVTFGNYALANRKTLRNSLSPVS